MRISFHCLRPQIDFSLFKSPCGKWFIHFHLFHLIYISEFINL